MKLKSVVYCHEAWEGSISGKHNRCIAMVMREQLPADGGSRHSSTSTMAYFDSCTTDAECRAFISSGISLTYGKIHE